jgi:hypothetical protein
LSETKPRPPPTKAKIKMDNTVTPDPRTAQDHPQNLVHSRRWRIPPRPPQRDQTRVDSPRQRARQRRIRIERAVCLIARAGCSTRAACRRVGLDYAAATEVCRLCDERGIARRHRWGTPYPKTIEGDYPVIIVKPPA